MTWEEGSTSARHACASSKLTPSVWPSVAQFFVTRRALGFSETQALYFPETPFSQMESTSIARLIADIKDARFDNKDVFQSQGCLVPLGRVRAGGSLLNGDGGRLEHRSCRKQSRSVRLHALLTEMGDGTSGTATTAATCVWVSRRSCVTTRCTCCWKWLNTLTCLGEAR